MAISCYCGDDFDFYFSIPDDFSLMPKFARRRRCASCKKLIDAEAVVLKLDSSRQPRCDFEENFYGDEVPLAPKFLCERCGEILMNLHAAGLCVTLDDNLENDLRKYWDMTGFDPQKYQGGKQQ